MLHDTVPDRAIDCRPHAELLQALREELPRVPRADLPGFFTAARRLAEHLPAELRARLAGFRRNGNEQGYLHLRGLPCDPATLPPTPTTTPSATPASPTRELLPMEAWISLLGAQLGDATGYRENRGGSVFQDVYPYQGAHHLTANAAPSMLRFHTEMAYHRHQPDFLVIACARHDHDRVAETLIGSVRRTVPCLDESDRRVLREVPLPWHVDLAFRSEANPDPQTSLLLLTGNDDILRYDGEMIVTDEVPAAAREGFAAFVEAFHGNLSRVRLEQGDVIVVDNNRTAHARTPFTPRWDGNDRWLQRIFVRDPQRSGHPAGNNKVVPFSLK